MLFVLPTHHDRMAVHRLPVVTLCIISLCVLVHIITHFSTPHNKAELQDAQEELVAYLLENPIVQLPEETLEGISPQVRDLIDEVAAAKERMGLDALDVEGLADMSAVLGGETENALDEKEIRRAALAEALAERIDRLESALGGNYFHKYGYIPSRGGVLTILTAMFIHSDIFHLLGNLLFLWLAGIALEDLWGRAIFPVFYLLGGFVAAWAHAGMFPESAIPCVGASGAIAAAMGAFMIRFYDAKIHFWYAYFFGFRFRRGSFKAYAYIMLPLWLAGQLWWGFIHSGDEQAGGVAFWAHIGGFATGALIALAFKYTGLEKKLIAPAVEGKSNLLDEQFSMGMDRLNNGDAQGAITAFRRAILNNPGDASARGQLCRAYLKTGQTKLAALEYRKSMKLLMEQDLMESAEDEYLSLGARNETFLLEPDREKAMIAYFESQNKWAEAAKAYKRLAARNLKNPDTRNHPVIAHALIACGDLLMKEMDQPKAAFMAYKKVLQSGLVTDSQQKKEVMGKAKQAQAAVAAQARLASTLQ